MLTKNNFNKVSVITFVQWHFSLRHWLNCWRSLLFRFSHLTSTYTFNFPFQEQFHTSIPIITNKLWPFPCVKCYIGTPHSSHLLCFVIKSYLHRHPQVDDQNCLALSKLSLWPIAKVVIFVPTNIWWCRNCHLTYKFTTTCGDEIYPSLNHSACESEVPEIGNQEVLRLHVALFV